MASIGWAEILICLFVVLLLFGANKLPDLARSMGRSARIFKSEVKEMKNDEAAEQPKQQHQIESAAAQETRSAAQDADFWEHPENQPRA
ncbi:prohead protease [Corynebacterium sp. HMSC05C01]|uniref:Sec-independent protein translocase subunit TatA n=1 Tax=unclassified Corynebacterium TaxID=2624378 RepID=UPI0008A2BD22|nr:MULTISPECIES: Sec-independent protein translocase subunit TatA [unclassified Corynebacterium]OFT68207.1 prohead protease [Corynebacterium sp. HMSC05C01]OFU54671.1 prohead protease [Corynebacterium sp. HMSC11D10]